MVGFEAANSWVSQQLGTATGVSSFALLLLGGVLASMLPCVYPLYPITAGILSARSSPIGRFAHPLVYYMGLVAVYFAFGIIASLTGGSFNEVLRVPAVHIAIGAFLFLLALATSGWLHFPALVNQSVKGPGFLNTFVMGAGAGLLSSACVGPVVVSILVAMAASTHEVSFATALLAASKMMFFGLGVGLPLLLIGVFGVMLPRGGTWMVRVQQLFGLLITWFAAGYVFKGLSGLGFNDGASWALLSGIALVGGAVFFAQDAQLSFDERTKRSILAVAFVVGFFVIGQSILSNSSMTLATARASSTPRTETHGNLSWHLDKTAAYSAAAELGKPVFVDFHGDWCTNCVEFQKLTLSDKHLNKALNQAVLLKVRDTTTLFDEYRNDPRFPELKVGLPFFVITDAKGQLLYKTSDYTKSKEMMLFLPDVEH